MGLEHLFAGLIAGWIVDKWDRKKEYSAANAEASLIWDVTRERLFVNARNKTIIANYQAIPAVWFDSCEGRHEFLDALIISEDERVRLQYYYSRLEVNPQSFECRTALIHYLYKSLVDDDETCLIPLLQNELLYLIDYALPTTQQERMYQQLAMFLSAEVYFFKGEFAKALKRLYQALDWQEIYDNAAEEVRTDFNGLESFHEAVVVNIINIYALSGLLDRTDEVRKAFSKMIADNRRKYSSIASQSVCSSTTSDNTFCSIFREFLSDSSDAFLARDSIQGFYTLSLNSYKENFFKESCTSIIDGQAIYSIECEFHQPKDIWFGEATGVYDGVLDTYPALFIRYRGYVTNYQAAIDRDRAEIMSI